MLFIFNINWLERACFLWHGCVLDMYSTLMHQTHYVMQFINSSLGAVPGNSEQLQYSITRYMHTNYRLGLYFIECILIICCVLMAIVNPRRLGLQ